MEEPSLPKDRSKPVKQKALAKRRKQLPLPAPLRNRGCTTRRFVSPGEELVTPSVVDNMQGPSENSSVNPKFVHQSTISPNLRPMPTNYLAGKGAGGTRSVTAPISIALLSSEEFDKCITEVGTYLFAVHITDVTRDDPVFGATTEVDLPNEYQDFHDVFFEEKANQLPTHAAHDHAIETGDSQPPYGPIYPLSVVELEVLRKYINEHLAKGFIAPSVSPAGAPTVFVKKND